jgi:hypothetical protein
MPTQSITADQAVERYWKTIQEVRATSLTESLLSHMVEQVEKLRDEVKTDPLVRAENFQKFLDEFAEMAWKCGFADALWAMSNGVVQAVPIENN